MSESLKKKLINDDDLINFRNEMLCICYGSFNVVHPGHLAYFKQSRMLNNKNLIVLQGDKFLNENDKKHFYKELERASQLLEFELVDYVYIQREKKLNNILEEIDAKYLLLGKEFEYSRKDEINEVLQAKKKPKIIYHSGEIDISPALVGEKTWQIIEKEKIKEFHEKSKTKKINYENIINKLKKLSIQNESIMTIGDSIIDRYIDCEALGMSAEAPLVVLKEIQVKDYIGGACVVSAHIANLGINSKFISVLGNDKELNKFIETELKKHGVNAYLQKDNSRRTTLKTRYLVSNQKQARISRLDSHEVSDIINKKLIKGIKQNKKNLKAIVISDFSYGVINKKILETIKEIANNNAIFLVGDVQTSSQRGDVKKLIGFDIVFATEKEIRSALNSHNATIETLSREIMNLTSCKCLILKLGSQGLISYVRGSDGYIEREYFPALSANPLDVTGAGDALMSGVVLGMCIKLNIYESIILGCYTAYLAVNRLGNKPIKKEEILDALESIAK